jgi:hypothetical protein
MNDRLKRNAERLQRCRDLNTPPEVLSRFARGSLSQVYADALAANPSTPVEDLLNLGARAPAALLRNPVWPLLVLADSSFLEQMPRYTQAALARCPESSPDLIRRLAGTNRRPVVVRMAAASNSATPMDVLKSFLRAAARVRVELVDNAKLPKAWHGRLAKDRSSAVRAALATRRDVSPNLLTVLSRDRSLMKVRVCVARNARTPYSALAYLSRSTMPAIQRALLENRRWNGPVTMNGQQKPDPLGFTRCIGVQDR